MNNYTNESEDILKGFKEFRYIIYGHEIAPTTGTPHLQGYFQLLKKHPMKYLLKRLCKGIHLDMARGGYDSNHAYCSKDAKDVYEVGTPEKSGSGRVKLYDIIMSCTTWDEVLPQINARDLSYAREVFGRKPVPIMDNFKPRTWQKRLISLLDEEPDDRSIIWIYDDKGGKGKTFLCKYLVANKGAFYITPSKTADILFAYNNEKIILYDIPRCIEEEYVNWGCIEKLKDGIYFTGKYQSARKVRQGNAHVVIFSNSQPPDGKFSEDRIKYVNLNG